MKKTTYRTAGREALLQFLQKNPDRQFTADELCSAIAPEASIKKSSLYRHLSELEAADTVRKFRGEEDGSALYQYTGADCDCRDRFHVKCTVCSRVCHLDCGESLRFAEHLLREHGFAADCGRSLLYGVCRDCRRQEVSYHA